MNKWVRGAIAGTIATIPMTLVMVTLFRRLPADQRYPLPPRLLMENFSARTGKFNPGEDAALTHATLAAHFAYGAVTGAMYPALETPRQPNMMAGVGYSVGIWAASYLGWIPAVKLLDPATRHPARRNMLMLAAHVVWGAALARISAALRPSADFPARAGARSQSRGRQTLLQGEIPFSRPVTPAFRSINRLVQEAAPSSM